MQPVLPYLVETMDAHRVFKGAVNEIQTNEECEFGIKTAVKIATLEHASARAKQEST